MAHNPNYWAYNLRCNFNFINVSYKNNEDNLKGKKENMHDCFHHYVRVASFTYQFYVMFVLSPHLGW